MTGKHVPRSRERNVRPSEHAGYACSLLHGCPSDIARTLRLGASDRVIPSGYGARVVRIHLERRWHHVCSSGPRIVHSSGSAADHITSQLKELAQIGSLELVREGANHTLYRVKGNPVTIPRHREIDELTAKAILRDAKGGK